MRFAHSEISIGEGGNATVELLVSPPLITTDVSVPLLLVGDADAYQLFGVGFMRSTAEGEERKATVTLTSEHTDTDSISFTIGAPDDADRFDDTVTLAIDEDNLPEGYALGVPSVAKVTIIDNDKRTITFVGEDGRTEENSGQTVSIDLQVSPPLDIGENFCFSLESHG